MKCPALFIPIVILLAGTAILIGCIPIPAFGTRQADGSPCPETAIGTDPKDAVRLGQTKIDNAFIELSQRVKSTQRSSLMGSVGSKVRPDWSILKWQVSPDGRRFALYYTVRTKTWVMPLCFATQSATEERWLILDVDPAGFVTGATTTRQSPRWPTPYHRWFELFDEPTRQKLREAGVFPDETHLRAADQAARHGDSRATSQSVPQTR